MSLGHNCVSKYRAEYFFFLNKDACVPEAISALPVRIWKTMEKVCTVFFLMQHNELGCTQSNAEESKNR